MSQFTALTAGADGDLDTTFKGTGQMTLIFPSGIQTISPRAAEGPDGNLYFGVSLHIPSHFALGIACLHKDGTPNVAFGTNGIVIERFTPRVSLGLQQIHFIEDGTETKILICAEDFSIKSNNLLARFHIDGRLDKTFGVDGLLRIVLPEALSGSPEQAPTPQESSDIRASGTSTVANGKIYLVGRVSKPIGVPDLTVVTRLNADGSLDTSFNKTGFVGVIKQDGDKVTVNDIFVQNGKITVCGSLLAGSPALNYGMLARLNDDGTFDETFADRGFFLYRDPGMTLHSLTRYAEDSILVAGRTSLPFTGVLACFNKEGQPDPRFNGGEILYHHFPEGRPAGFYSVAVVQGRIIASGAIHRTTGADSLIVARYLMDGTADHTFGQGKGWASADFNDFYGNSSTMLIQKDGKVLLVGSSEYEFDHGPTNPIARFLNTSG